MINLKWGEEKTWKTKLRVELSINEINLNLKSRVLIHSKAEFFKKENPPSVNEARRRGKSCIAPTCWRSLLRGSLVWFPQLFNDMGILSWFMWSESWLSCYSVSTRMQKFLKQCLLFFSLYIDIVEVLLTQPNIELNQQVWIICVKTFQALVCNCVCLPLAWTKVSLPAFHLDGFLFTSVE